MKIQGVSIYKKSGFTLIELVATILLLGILAVSVSSQFSSKGSFAERTVRDRLISIARYAQQRAMYDQDPTHCYRLQINATDYGAQRNLNDGNGFQYFGPAITDKQSPTDPDNPLDGSIQVANGVTISNTPITIYFDGLGNPVNACNGAPVGAQQTITITGTDITQQVFVEGTGYVHW